MLALGTLLTVLDSIAAGVGVMEAAIGVDGTVNGTVSKAAASNRDVLAALDDQTVQNDLTPIFARRAALVLAATLYPTLQGSMINRSLDVHYGNAGLGTLNAYLFSQDSRVHPNLRKIGMQLDARNVFMPTVLDPVATYEGTASAGSGLFAIGSDIDTNTYGPAKMEVVVDVMGNSQRNLSLTMKKFDGTTEARAVNIPANAAPGTVFPIGAGSDRYIGVTNITTTNGGGTAADRLHVRSIVERALVL